MGSTFVRRTVGWWKADGTALLMGKLRHGRCVMNEGKWGSGGFFILGDGSHEMFFSFSRGFLFSL